MTTRARAENVERLVLELSATDSTRREAAVARLRVIGERALARLAPFIQSDAPAGARAAALAALEGVDDPRASALALGALASPDADIAIAALNVLRTWVTRESGTRVLDALTGVALDASRDPSVRLAAMDGLSQLPRPLVQPVLEQARKATSARPAAPEASMLHEWLGRHGDTAALPELHALVERARDQETAEPSAGGRQPWLVARGAVHAALARRRSRVALYDLREAFDAAREPLPLDFLNAVSLIGDVTCLEPLARAWQATPHDDWWRERLSDAAGDIMKRERLTARHAVVKKVRARWKGFL